jgi:hypothetical protein
VMGFTSHQQMHGEPSDRNVECSTSLASIMDGASAPEQQRRLRTHRASGRASNNQANIYQIQKERKKSSRGGYAPTDVRKPLAARSIPNAKGEKGRKKRAHIR